MTSLPAADSPDRAEILVVEDDPGSRETLIYLLEAEGYRVTGVNDGLEALEYLDAGGLPCLILLDLSLPRLDGAGFRRRQQANPALAAIPVVVMTGVYESPALAHTVDAADYFLKPYSVKELLSTVAHYCRPGGAG